ncbi:MAG: hypothetical protein U1F35_14835 [Steroidobacteraceae bacterium]
MSTAGLITPTDASGLRVETHLDPQPVREAFERESSYFESMPEQGQWLHLWQPRQGLAVTLLEAGHAHFAVAAAQATAAGFPVEVRRSGGGCVALGPGMLVISHLYCTPYNDIDRGYRRFAAKLVAAASRLKIRIGVGQVQRSYCDGRFDLRWRSFKVGGIAQRRRVGSRRTRAWVQGVLSVEAGSSGYPVQVQSFYRALGSERDADPGVCATLAQAIAEDAALLPRFAQAVQSVFCVSAARGMCE